MTADTRFRWFREERCDRCGLCFMECPVLGLPEAEARRDIEALIAGDVERSKAFRYCTTCNLCDALCPQRADPYELLLQRFFEDGRARGLPPVARLVLPTERGNLWSGVRCLMGPGERSLLDRWRLALDRPHDEILLTGFYANLVPYLGQATVLDPLRPHTAGAEGLWGCGGDTHKMGLLDHTAQVAPLLQRAFQRMGVRKVWCFMSAEAAMLSEVLPQRYGARFDVEVGTLDEWLRDRLQRGEIEVTAPQTGRVAVHDHCMSRYLGGRLHGAVRDVVRACGGSLVEMEHCRDRTLCCGWAATIPTLYGPGSDRPRRSLTYMLASLRRRLDEAHAAGAEAVVASCPACYLFLNLAAVLGGDALEILHPVELVERAAGGDPVRRARQRAVDVLAVAAALLLDEGAGGARFHPAPLDPATWIEPRPVAAAEARSLRRWAAVLRATLLRPGPQRLVVTRGLRRSSDLYGWLMRLRLRSRGAREAR